PVPFIENFHHPHSGLHSSIRILLDTVPVPPPISSSTLPITEIIRKPWAPFQTHADFEFMEQVVTKCMDKEMVEILLRGYNREWATLTRLTLQNIRDVEDSLLLALFYSALMIFQFCNGEVNHTIYGQPYCFKFKYHDPWQCILDIITDHTPSKNIIWFPVQKYLYEGLRITCIYDELNTGNAWWTIQGSLPNDGELPHFFSPLHI
ncbi:hypothetical protein BU17DRAFT_16545, partial [Hysterangium stoloniferum]